MFFLILNSHMHASHYTYIKINLLFIITFISFCLHFKLVRLIWLNLVICVKKTVPSSDANQFVVYNSIYIFASIVNLLMSIQLNLAKCIKTMGLSMLYLPTNVCKSVCNVALEMNQFLIKTTERENDLPKRQFGMHSQRERIAFSQEATAI